MAYGPDSAAIRITPEIEKHLQTLNSSEEIKAYLAEVAVDQQLVTRDIYSPDVLIPTVLADNPSKRFAKAVILNGVKHVVEGATEQELLQSETAIYKAALSQPSTPTRQQKTEQPRNEQGKFVRVEQQVADRAELELKFKRGEISASDYIQQSGAVADYLEKQGVPLEELKAQVQEKQDQRYQQSWASSVEEFLHSPAGADWPAGENLPILARLIEENGLTDSPSAETISRVWAHMKENGLVVDTPATIANRERIQLEERVNNAQSPSELAAALNLQERQYAIRASQGTGLFNR